MCTIQCRVPHTIGTRYSKRSNEAQTEEGWKVQPSYFRSIHRTALPDKLINYLKIYLLWLHERACSRTIEWVCGDVREGGLGKGSYSEAALLLR